MKHNIYNLVLTYLRAAAQLFGCIELQEIYAIFTQHNPGLLTARDFYRIARAVERDREIFRIIGDDDIYTHSTQVRNGKRLVVHKRYCYATWDEFFLLEVNHEGKPLRRFSKEEMLAYGDTFYTPDSPQVDHLRQMLEEHAPEGVDVEDLVHEALNLARDDCDIADFLHEMQRLGCSFGSFRDRVQAVSCFGEVFNTVPKPSLRGHTEEEMRRLPLQPESKQKHRHLMDHLCRDCYAEFCETVRKLQEDAPYCGETQYGSYLNRCIMEQDLPPPLFEPCPCGSRLYYADCCGKR